MISLNFPGYKICFSGHFRSRLYNRHIFFSRVRQTFNMPDKIIKIMGSKKRNRKMFVKNFSKDEVSVVVEINDLKKKLLFITVFYKKKKNSKLI